MRLSPLQQTLGFALSVLAAVTLLAAFYAEAPAPLSVRPAAPAALAVTAR